MANNSIDSLIIEVDASASSADRALDKLADNLDKISAKINGIKVTDFTRNMDNLKKSVSGFDTGSLEETVTLFRRLSNIDTGKLSNVSAGVKEISDALKGLSGITIPNIAGIDSLISNMRKFGGKSMTAAVQNLPQLSSYLTKFVSSMNGIGALTFDAAGLSNIVASISKLGGTKATQAAKNLSPISAQLQNFIRQLNSIGSVKFDMTGLTELVSAISKLGGKTSTQAIPNIQALGTALKQLMVTLSTAPKVSSNVIQMTRALADLASQGSKVGTATRGLTSIFNRFSLSASSARRQSLSLAAAFGKLYANFWFLRRAIGLFKQAIDISSDLTEVQNVVDVTFGNMAYKVEEFAKTSIEQFGMSELSLKQYASRFQAMGSAMGISNSLISSANSFLNEQTAGYVGLSDSMSDVSLNLTKLTADMASFYNVEQSAVAEDLESIFTGQTRPLRTYGLDLTQATLQEWAMKQGIDADIKSMSQAEKTMLRYQYVLANTSAAQGDFARTADTWANQVRILKQNFEQLGAIVGGAAINAFKPFLRALNTVLQKVISFAKTIADALGKIFGWTMEVSSGGITDDLDDAGSGADDLADGIGNAADNAKDLKDTLTELNIDQLHKLATTPDASSGSGSGSGGSSGGSGSGLNAGLVKTESLLDKYKSEINNLFQLGEYIGDTLTNALDSIDWNRVYQGARNFGTGLADFLNGLISPELFGAVGRTIAGALNTAIYAALAFGQTFDWKDLGKSIASGINNFFSTFDFKALADTLNTWVDGLEDLFFTTISNIDWKQIAKDAIDFGSTLELDTIALLLTFTVGKPVIKWAFGNIASSILTALVGNSGILFAAGTGVTAAGLALGVSASLAIYAAVQWKLDKKAVQNWHDKIDEIKANIGLKNKSGQDTSHDEAALEYYQRTGPVTSGNHSYSYAMNEGLGVLKEGISNKFSEIDFKGFFEDFNKEMQECFPIQENLEEAWDGFRKYVKKRKLEMTASIENFKDNIKEKRLNFQAKLTTWKETLREKVLNFQAKLTTWRETLKEKVLNFQAKLTTWKESLREKVLNFQAKLTTWMDSLKDKKITFTAKITSFVDNIKNKVISGFGVRGNAGGGIYTNGQWQSIQGYASGGSPQSARLFYANENGIPELIGRIGNNTAVMNNSQIVASVAAGVYQAVAAALGGLQSYFASMTYALSNIPVSLDNFASDFEERFASISPESTYSTIDSRVINQDTGQIASGIAAAVQPAVYNGMMMALASQGGTGGKTVEIPIYLDGKEISRTVLDYQKMQNKRYILEPSFT